MPDALLHNRFPELAATLPFLRLGTAPTPVRRLTVGTRVPLWCKDDSGYGDGGWGGNKVRKLEWLLPDVRARGARTILTVGGTGTNWGLATALYARAQGIGTALALVDQPMDEHVRAQLRRLENSGAALHFTRTKRRTRLLAPLLYLRHRRPYFLPVGGSSPLGAVGYVEAALELAEQVTAGLLPEPSHVVTAVGSGGTAAGLALGLRLAGLRTRVVGVIVNDTLPLDAPHLVRLAEGTERLLRARGARFETVRLRPAELTVTADWLGAGYGHPTPAARTAQALAENDGLRLETVYTAKALAAVRQLDADAAFGAGPVLFLNTYGPR